MSNLHFPGVVTRNVVPLQTQTSILTTYQSWFDRLTSAKEKRRVNPVHHLSLLQANVSVIPPIPFMPSYSQAYHSFGFSSFSI